MQTRIYLMLLTSLLALGATCPLAPAAESPLLISCSGRLFDGEKLLSGDLPMLLRVYDHPSKGHLLYEDSNTVRVVEGIYTTFLGDNTSKGDLVVALAAGEAYLEVVADGITFAPREKLVSVPYAAIAHQVRKAGVTAEMLGPQAVGGEQLADASVTGAKLAPGSVGSDHLADGAVQTRHLAEEVMTADKIKGFWTTAGNAAEAGKVPFLGTLEPRPLILRVHNRNALRIDPRPGTPNLVAGHEGNRADREVEGVTIAGGGSAELPNHAESGFAVISGGQGNRVTGGHAAVGGGLENRASGQRAVVSGGRANLAASSGAVVGGGYSNVVHGSYAVVGGGYSNRSEGYVTTVSGGWGNVATGLVSVVSGGQDNQALGDASAVGGGWQNQTTGYGAVISGGRLNQASGRFAVIGGGTNNVVAGEYAVVPGGSKNRASGAHSLAAGHGAQSAHAGSFVWADAQGGVWGSTAKNQFLIRAGGNVGIDTPTPTEKLTVEGKVKAQAFIGDGSQLTGIPPAAPVPGSIGPEHLKPGFQLAGEQLQGDWLTPKTVFAGEVSGSAGQLTIKPGILGNAHLAAKAAIAPEKIAGTALTSQTVFGGDVEGPAGALRLRAGSVTPDKLSFDPMALKAFAAEGGGMQFGPAQAEAVSLVSGGQPVLRILPGPTAPNLVGGAAANHMAEKLDGVVIAGGGSAKDPHLAAGPYGVISGGLGNKVENDYATVGGGFNNEATGSAATVAGGWNNVASELDATVAGGQDNISSGSASTVAGGFNNRAVGSYAMVPGGVDNLAGGEFSLAAGRRAQAKHAGTFVWSDSTDADFASSGDNQFLIRARGNVGIDTSAPAEKLTVAGNVAPATTAAHALGTPALRWDALFLDEHIEFAKRLHFNSGGQTLLQLDAAGNLSSRGLRLQVDHESITLVAGSPANQAGKAAVGATISGGGNAEHPNQVAGQYGTVSGGFGNQVLGFDGAIGGGQDNVADGTAGTIAGGFMNKTEGLFPAVGGGAANVVEANLGVVSGGFSNRVAGAYAMIPGGAQNVADGDYALAAGRRARAAHTGAYVWADATDAEFASTARNQFRVRASGGVYLYTSSDLSSGVKLNPGSGSWSMLSDVNSKENLNPHSGLETLKRLVNLPIYQWNYRSQDAGSTHLGPTSQDFMKAFGLGEETTHISAIDADGVALSAIQGLYDLIQEKDREVKDLKAENAALQRRLERIEAVLEKLP